jgi:fumarate reductase subunit D
MSRLVSLDGPPYLSLKTKALMTPAPEQQHQPAAIQSASVEPVREQDKIQLILAYLGILALVPYLTVKDSDFVKFHAKQGLVLTVIGGVILSTITCGFFTPVYLVVSVIGIIKSLKGERWRIPVVADLADKF